jgi:hypothetical protein
MAASPLPLHLQEAMLLDIYMRDVCEENVSCRMFNVRAHTGVGGDEVPDAAAEIAATPPGTVTPPHQSFTPCNE